VEYTDRFKGRRVATEGMVAWDKSDVHRFYLFRFLIVCCVADAQPIAVLVEQGAIERPRQNTWVKVEGFADATKVGSETAMIIRKATVTSIKAPKDPYLY
jgi:putative membrane protein